MVVAKNNIADSGLWQSHVAAPVFRKSPSLIQVVVLYPKFLISF